MPPESSPPPQGARTTATAAALPDNVDITNTSAISRRSAPPIPGLFMDPALLLPTDLADSALRACMSTFFADAGINQVMLFGRAGDAAAAFPPFLSALLGAASELLLRHPTLPRETHAMLFAPTPPPPPPPEGHGHDGPLRARQAIVNLYRPGEGIAPHVDLLNRFGDGIVGVSLGGGASMRFARAQAPRGRWDVDDVAGQGGGGGGGHGDGDGEFHEVWLPPRSVLVLTREARYEWTHGIAPRVRDKVEDAAGRDGWQWHERGVRVSVTFRWLLPGAEIVGGSETNSDDGMDCEMDAGRQGGGR